MRWHYFLNLIRIFLSLQNLMYLYRLFCVSVYSSPMYVHIKPIHPPSDIITKRHTYFLVLWWYGVVSVWVSEWESAEQISRNARARAEPWMSLMRWCSRCKYAICINYYANMCTLTVLESGASSLPQAFGCSLLSIREIIKVGISYSAMLSEHKQWSLGKSPSRHVWVSACGPHAWRLQVPRRILPDKRQCRPVCGVCKAQSPTNRQIDLWATSEYESGEGELYTWQTHKTHTHTIDVQTYDAVCSPKRRKRWKMIGYRMHYFLIMLLHTHITNRLNECREHTTPLTDTDGEYLICARVWMGAWAKSDNCVRRNNGRNLSSRRQNNI